MPTWYIEPRDPLIVRDGRPFGPDPGARARSISFPVPSTVTGGFRGRAGLKDRVFDRSKTNIDRVMSIHVRGPMLASLKNDGTLHEWLPPAPADALLLQHHTTEQECERAEIAKQRPPDMRVSRLLPLAEIAGAAFSLPDGPALALVGPRVAENEKPAEKLPRFWRWKEFESWLTSPVEGARVAADLGIAGPTSESRTHVGVDPKTKTAEDGRLFQTSGLEFTTNDRTRLALVVESATPLEGFAKGGFAPLGGERRLVAWRPGAPELPSCPKAIRARILAERACRVVLLTPAHFTHGYRPTWLLNEHKGVAATLVAALVQRPQVISGWDMWIGKPKPTRRLVPAGSVYFLKLLPKADVGDDAISAWIDAIWMQNMSDDAQDRRDGFGLAALGTWDGALTTMEVQ